MHRTTSRFWTLLGRLPEEVQVAARAQFALLKQDDRHPSLHFKRVGRYWSVRIGMHYRALAEEDGGDLIWVWIGRHDDYDRLLKRQ